MNGLFVHWSRAWGVLPFSERPVYICLCVLHVYNMCAVCIRNGKSFDIHWYGGGLSIAMVFYLRRVSDLFWLLCHLKDIVLHCSKDFKWNEIVWVRVPVQRVTMLNYDDLLRYMCMYLWCECEYLGRLAINGNSQSKDGIIQCQFSYIRVELLFRQWLWLSFFTMYKNVR